ncbi:hypothetical protein Tcan_05709 [Toxocara canis]|uniref:Uncharacterized protein n=1 Tax=Toxocara canis TaxID=6265 RepID=A0A0B2V8D4_TOXCA|nr:hypothetical protein Tcan_05709 [Toxocara canis]
MRRSQSLKMRRSRNVWLIVAKLLLLIIALAAVACLLSERTPVCYRGKCSSVVGRASSVAMTSSRHAKRQNMERCAPIYGKIMIFIAVESNAFKVERLYGVAVSSVRCYCASTNYELKIVDVFNDTRVNQQCSSYASVFFQKHCAAAAYLNETDWMLVIDADTGVVNPNHCIEEYIDDRVNLLFYERFFNWEIMSGNYLARNSEYTRMFLMRWADYQFLELGGFWWKGFDNGALHAVFLDALFSRESQEYKNCEAAWYESDGYETYMQFVICVRTYLGAQRLWPGKIRLLRRAHGMARDWLYSDDEWCEADFMFHGWKHSQIDKDGWLSPFTAVPNVSLCGNGYSGWYWRAEKRKTVLEIRETLRNAERHTSTEMGRLNLTFPFLSLVDVGLCYPECDRDL